MPGKPTRTHIVEAADSLFYERGYEHTSFSDIANAVRISRGNFYHHFKSKDEILDAVIDLRASSTQTMLERWESEEPHPVDRIRRFIRMLLENRSKIMLHGCPVGTLCTELAKIGHPSKAGANRLFAIFRVWLRRQFVLLGRKSDADAMALHLLVLSQGIAVLANAFHDEGLLGEQARRMDEWLDRVAETRPAVLP